MDLNLIQADPSNQHSAATSKSNGAALTLLDKRPIEDATIAGVRSSRLLSVQLEFSNADD